MCLARNLGTSHFRQAKAVLTWCIKVEGSQMRRSQRDLIFQEKQEDSLAEQLGSNSS